MQLTTEEQNLFKESCAYLNKRKRNRKRNKQLIKMSVIIALLSMFTLTAWALIERYNANHIKEKAIINEEEAKKNEELAKENLANFKAELAKRQLLEFNNLESKAIAILQANMCPKEILNKMDSIASQHYDSLKLFEVIEELSLKNPDCQ